MNDNEKRLAEKFGFRVYEVNKRLEWCWFKDGKDGANYGASDGELALWRETVKAYERCEELCDDRSAMYSFWVRHVVRVVKELRAAEERSQQLEVQLAGCSVAALGSGQRGEQVAKQGDYGWSPAYQDVLNLRRKYEAALGVIEACKPFMDGNSSRVRPERMTREFEASEAELSASRATQPDDSIRWTITLYRASRLSSCNSEEELARVFEATLQKTLLMPVKVHRSGGTR